MHVVEKTHEGLSRSFGVTIPAADLGAMLDARIAEILPSLNLKGFRPGKVPPAHVRRLYGKSLMGEVVEKTLNETSQKLLADHQLRVAAQPDLKPLSDMEKVLAGAEDLSFDLEVEVMPDFEPADVTALELTRPVYAAPDEEIDAELTRLAEMNRTYEAKAKRKAETGDQVLMDFVGRLDGEVFEGGSAEGAEIVLGSGQFIPGFEEQLIGAKAGETRTVEVTFPEGYQAAHLAGKPAAFEVTVHEVRAPKESAVDDALGQRLGFSDLEGLRAAIRANVEREYAGASRFKLKRALLDALDARHDIPLPPRMVEAEFDQIWQQVEKDREGGTLSPEDEGKDEATLRAEYRKIAERRVRLGLVLAEIGRRANVQVSDAELGEAMRAEAMRYGEQAQQIFDLMRQNPNIQASMRAPLYEEKVVDYIVGQAKVTDRAVSKDELMADDDLPASYADGGETGAKPKAAAKKKAPAKAKAAKDEASGEAETGADAAPAADAAAEPAAKPKASKPKAAKPKTPKA